MNNEREKIWHSRRGGDSDEVKRSRNLVVFKKRDLLLYRKAVNVVHDMR